MNVNLTPSSVFRDRRVVFLLSVPEHFASFRLRNKLARACNASERADYSRDLETSDGMRRLKMMSHKARSGLIRVSMDVHEFSAALEIATDKKSVFRDGLLHTEGSAECSEPDRSRAVPNKEPRRERSSS